MVRLWSEEVGDAKSVIEPLVNGIDPTVDIDVNGDKGFRKETVEVRLRKSGRLALCIVTFEAWVNAKTNPADMEAAFRQILAELERKASVPAYLLTSRGLATDDAAKGSEILRDIAASTEADVLAEKLPKRLK